jgi:thiosulfate/3-mercaptopyruvate sulfurtransferase
MSGYAFPGSLASTQWVADHTNEDQVRFVEIIWGSSLAFGKLAYEDRHIPGAVAWDFEGDLQDPVRKDVIDKPGIEALLSTSGITPTMTIVLYSGLSNILATYAFWMLKIYGHQDVRLMDGDRQIWLDENRPTESKIPKISSTIYTAKEPDWSLRASREDVSQVLNKAGHCLIDARSAAMFCGQDKARAARGGHISGAINLAASREINPDGSFKAWRIPTVQADGTFKPPEALKALFENLDITADKKIITYCVGGGLSTHAWFVLTQLLGYRNVREYDRSWAEWGNLEDTPVET